MKTTTLAELIETEDLHSLTRWLMDAIKRMKPSKKMLESEAVVMDKALPKFRNASGGVVKIGGVLIGNSAGNGYFNGQVGPWREIKHLIKSYLQNGKAEGVVVSAVATPAKSHKAKAVDELEIADPRTYNEAMNLRHNGSEETRKTWINYALQRELNEKAFSKNF